MTPTDADAIRASLVRPSAFGVVFDRHFPGVHAFAQRRRYDGAHPDALPWLLGIATNVMRRHWRAERRRLAAYARAAAHEVPAVEPDVSEEVITAVARLPRRQREVVLLYAWADLSYEQIARALDLPVGTVRSRLSRARHTLGLDLALANA